MEALILKDQIKDYQLIDSGNGEKLERFGRVTISRQSTQCIWKTKKPDSWTSINAEHDGKKWERNAAPKLTPINIHGVTFNLEAQENGQVGFFPEHSLYLPLLTPYLGADSKVLNLFAYTGLASLFALKTGAAVTHVDLATHALDKFRVLVEQNKFSDPEMRILKEDALTYIAREAKRGQKYDVVIADPPSFSRPSKNTFWKIEEILADLFINASAVATKAIVVTCHHPGVTHRMLANLASDIVDEKWDIKSTELLIQESDTERCIGAGDIVLLTSKQLIN